MIVFVAVWSGDEGLRRRALEGLRRTAAAFPDLVGVEPAITDWAGRSWVACVDAGWPCQSSMGPERAVILEGLALRGGQVQEPARVPADVDASTLDGQFGLVDADRDHLRVVTDPAGHCPLYWARHGDTWLVANRVATLVAAVGSTDIDIEGAASYLALGWPLDGRTLRRSVSVVPLGSDVSWSAGRTLPLERPHGPFLPGPRAGPSTADLAADLIRACSAIGRWSGRVQAPITAGIDSRVIVALLEAAGVGADYYTVGPGRDAQVGADIAARLGLDHEVVNAAGDDVVAAWPSLAARLLSQNDGLISLWQAGDLLVTPSRPVLFWGSGGDIARGRGTGLRAALEVRKRPQIERFVHEVLTEPLLTADGRAAVRELLVRRLETLVELPHRRRDLRDVFYAYERHRIYGANLRKTAPALQFSPFALRRFYQSAFALSPALRPSAPLHRRLLRHLAPELERYPVDGGGWLLPYPYLNLVQSRARQRKGVASRDDDPQLRYLGRLHQGLLARCLDRSTSSLWEVVDRGAVERLMKTDGGAPEVCRAAKSVMAVTTLFEYEARSADGPGFSGDTPKGSIVEARPVRNPELA